MRFAARAEFGEEESAYGEALRLARARSGFIDLTVSNPTRCGFHYPTRGLLAPFADPAMLRYDADPLGMRSAREAVSRLYRDIYGSDVPANRLLLTASTSEAYSHLLRLFCEPGDNILVPSPSYPLFDLLARLHDVHLVHYPLVYHDGWQIDPASLAAAVTPRTRAIVAVHPNNPTGHYCSPADREVLHRIAQEHGLPLIVDEVFLDYEVEANHPSGRPTFAKPRWKEEPETGSQVLTFVLGGLSKLLALPQMKLAWMVVCGPDALAREAMAMLEVIADTFLSVATPPQVALPSWLAERKGIQGDILGRVRANLRTLDEEIAGTACGRLRVEGGWAAVLRVPALEPDIALVVRLLQEQAVAVHPGSFYGFPSGGWLVLSLLPEPGVFREGLRCLLSGL